MKKVLILANFDVGLYRFRKELIEKFIEQKNQVYISLPYGEMVEPLKEIGCQFIDTPVDRRGINPVTDGKLFLKYLKILREVKPDLVVTYTIKPNIYGGLASRISRIPYAVNITGLGTAFQKDGFVKKLVCFLYKISCKKAKTVFFENEGNRNVFLEHGLVEKKKTFTLPGAGINLDNYTYQVYKRNEKVHFLYVGRIMKEKGMDELFAAVRKLREEGYDFVLDLVGFFEDSYKEQVKQLQKDGIAVFHGFQEDPRPYYADADCIVVPSYHEGMSNVLLEAATMGRPIITTDIHGCKEAVEDKKTGILCKVQDRQSLYEAMKEFLGLTIDERADMGRLGREKMEEEFDKRKVVGMTVERLFGIT